MHISYVNFWKHKASRPSSSCLETAFLNFGLRDSRVLPAWPQRPRLCQRQVGLGSAAQPVSPVEKGRDGPVDVTHFVFSALWGDGGGGDERKERFRESKEEKDSQQF